LWRAFQKGLDPHARLFGWVSLAAGVTIFGLIGWAWGRPRLAAEVVLVLLGAILLEGSFRLLREADAEVEQFSREPRPYLDLKADEVTHAVYGPFRKRGAAEFFEEVTRDLYSARSYGASEAYTGGTIPAPTPPLEPESSAGAALPSEAPTYVSKRAAARARPPCWARALAVNDPPDGFPGATARKVAARVKICGADGSLLVDMQGRWSASEQEHERARVGMSVEHLETDIPANEFVPRPIDLAMKYPDDEDCFAYNDENSRMPDDGRLESHRLVGKTFIVEVAIRDGEGRRASRRFVLTNPGARHDLQLAPAEEEPY
jgi:hypothetical protein